MKKFLALLLVSVMILGVLSSCAKNDAPAPGGETTAPTTPAPAPTPTPGNPELDAVLADSSNRMLVKAGVCDYVIVIPAGANDGIRTAANDLAADIAKITGATPAVVEDTTAEVEKEILVGTTNRAQTAEVYATIRTNDLKIVSSGSKIVVAANTAELLLRAAKRVVGEVQYMEGPDGAYAWISATYKSEMLGEYNPDMITIGDNQIKDYVIVYGATETDAAAARGIQALISSTCGYILPMVKAGADTAVTEKEILVGDVGRGYQLTGTNTYEMGIKEGKLVLYYSNAASSTKAIADYDKQLVAAIEAMADDATSVAIDALAVSGTWGFEVGHVFYSESFDGKDTSKDYTAIHEELGWVVASYANSRCDLAYTSDGKLQLNNKWATSAFVDDTVMSGLDKYTLEGKFNITSGINTLCNVIFNYNGAPETMKDAIGNEWMVLSFRGVDSEGNRKDAVVGDTLGVSLIRMVTYQKDENTVGAYQYNVLGDDRFVPLTNAAIGIPYDVKMVVDNTNATVDVYVNGTKVLEYKSAEQTNVDKQMSTNAGTMAFWVQNTTVTIDDLAVKYGDTTTLESTTPTLTVDQLLADENSRVIIKAGVSDYVVVYPAGASEDIIAVANTLATNIGKLTGATPAVVADSTAEAEKEILVGKTNRTASTEVYAALRINDLKVVSSGTKVVIAGHSAANLTVAANRFAGEIKTLASDAGVYGYIAAAYATETLGAYSLSAMTIGEADVKGYTIVYGATETDAATARAIQALISTTYGYILPMVQASGSEPVAEKEILVGDCGRGYTLTGDNKYEIGVKSGKLVVYYANPLAATIAIAEYENAVSDAVAALEEGVTTLALDAVTVDGDIEAGATLYANNFNNKDTEKNESETHADLGWQTASYAGNACLVNYTEDGKLQIKPKWATSAFVDNKVMSGVDVYTLEGDFNVAAGKNALCNIIFNYDGAPNTMKNAVDKEWMVLSFRCVNGEGTFVQDTENTALGVTLIKMKTYYNTDRNIIGTIQYNVLGDNKYTPISDTAIGEDFNAKMVVDNTNGTINVYINGTLVMEYKAADHTGQNTEMCKTAGTMAFWVEHTTIEIDNLAVKYGDTAAVTQ